MLTCHNMTASTHYNMPAIEAYRMGTCPVTYPLAKAEGRGASQTLSNFPSTFICVTMLRSSSVLLESCHCVGRNV